jgi:release factor glutamine methyltransferase
VDGAGARLRPGGLLALEVGLGQAEVVGGRIRATGAFGAPRVRRDLAGRPRILLAERG